MILKLTTFQTGRLKIPHASSSPNGADRKDEVQGYIDEFEREALVEGLGYTLSNQIITANGTPELLEAASQRIKDLVKGKTYKLNGIDVNWEGMKEYSFLAYYVFYKFLKDNVIGTFSTFGIERPEGKNSVSASPNLLLVNSYQTYFNKYQGDIYATEVGKQRSLYHFLNDNKLTYPEVEQFTFKERMNQFGI